MTGKPRDPALEVTNLNAWYGDSHVLHGTSLEVFEGETVTLLGRNGVGKTTTLRAILGIVTRRTGDLRANGQDLTSIPLHRIARAGLGYVPEDRGIFASLTVEENLLLPPAQTGQGVPLQQIYELFPNLHERRSSVGTKLSGGEQQMLAIARVLRSGARLLLLDEPTEGLAPVIVAQIGSLLRDLKLRGYTVLMVEQNLRFAARVADRFYLMEEGGRIVDELDAAAAAQDIDGLTQRLGL